MEFRKKDHNFLPFTQKVIQNTKRKVFYKEN